MNLRLIVPPDRTELVMAKLADDDCITNLIILKGGAVRPAGDFLQCEVTREAVADVLGWLRGQSIYDDGSVVLSEVSSAPSTNARATEAAAPGAPDDAIVWDAVLDSAYGEVRGSWSFYAFLTLDTAIAAGKEPDLSLYPGPEQIRAGLFLPIDDMLAKVQTALQGRLGAGWTVGKGNGSGVGSSAA